MTRNVSSQTPRALSGAAMNRSSDPVSNFYWKHLGVDSGGRLTAECPFCRSLGFDPGKLQVVLNPDSFFHGYFRCSNRCVGGGFPAWYARLAGILAEEVPGIDPDEYRPPLSAEYPQANINATIDSFLGHFPDALKSEFVEHCVRESVLQEMKVGFNGRYLVFPYIQEDGNCYSARCVHPDRLADFFWHGDERFSKEPFNIYNVQDIGRCENGALFICEGERNLLALRQMGFPGVAVSEVSHLERLPAALFERIRTVFLLAAHRAEAIASCRHLAARIGYRARLILWETGTPEGFDLWALAAESGKNLGDVFGRMLKATRAFSPFSNPDREYRQFLHGIQSSQQEDYQRMLSGFPLLDSAVGGIHGINVIGGGPKVGKSTFMIQIASEMAARRIPVLYYDFENGRQKIYQRTLSRLSRLETSQLHGEGLSVKETNRLQKARQILEKMMFYWRVINDRQVTPELLRRHIDFIRHETRNRYTVVVVDSLHKLPFKDFSEHRTGIDAWLREMESIRDELEVSFLVVSELSREETDGYRVTPHLGVFKGSGDIEYSADNAFVLAPRLRQDGGAEQNCLWLVASREHSPGQVADYQLDYPYWGFHEESVQS